MDVKGKLDVRVMDEYKETSIEFLAIAALKHMR